ncbi:hypothetical protein BpHYR1_019337, partial [Brachionus plicatilis]
YFYLVLKIDKYHQILLRLVICDSRIHKYLKSFVDGSQLGFLLRHSIIRSSIYSTDLFLWFYQNLREFTKILEFRYIYFSALTSRHYSQLQFQLPNLNPIEMLWNEMKEFAR